MVRNLYQMNDAVRLSSMEQQGGGPDGIRHTSPTLTSLAQPQPHTAAPTSYDTTRTALVRRRGKKAMPTLTAPPPCSAHS